MTDGLVRTGQALVRAYGNVGARPVPLLNQYAHLVARVEARTVAQSDWGGRSHLEHDLRQVFRIAEQAFAKHRSDEALRGRHHAIHAEELDEQQCEQLAV